MLEGILVDLVPFDQTYVDLMHKWENNESSFWSSLGEQNIVTRAQIKAGLEADDSYMRQALMFGVRTKDSAGSVPIGFFGANWIEAHHRLAEIGYVIGEPAYWSRGYGTDAVLLLIEYLFDWLDLHKICLDTMGINARMVRQMEKIGFTLEARQRAAVYAESAFSDLLWYGMLRDEWAGREAAIERIGLRA